MEYRNIRPSKINLDPQNPRLPDGTSSDREAVNRLLADGDSQMIELARDLVNRGTANPTELPIVLKDGNRFLVLEGNRRVAALKLLDDPRMADKIEHQKALERIKKNGNGAPSILYCAVVKDRDEADHWITLRHTGANKGVGVRTWNTEESARHRRRMKAPVDSGTGRSIAIADELTEAYQADTNLVDLIAKVRSAKLTNIGRFFSGVTLTRMQFALRPAPEDSTYTLWAKHTTDQLHSYFLWAFQYLDVNSVDAFKNDALRDKLINSCGHVLPDVIDSMPEYKRLTDLPYSQNSANTGDTSSETNSTGDDNAEPYGGYDSDSSSDVQKNTEKKNNDNEPTKPTSGNTGGRKRDITPERFLYSGVKLANLSPSTQRLLREAKQQPIEHCYATACVLSRVILELSVSDPKVLKWTGKNEGSKLAEKIRGCILKLDPQIESLHKRTRYDLLQAHLETKEIGIIYLHQFMHNPSTRSDPHLARRFSAAFTPLLNSIDDAVK